jgi:hypothetical protein
MSGRFFDARIKVGMTGNYTVNIKPELFWGVLYFAMKCVDSNDIFRSYCSVKFGI